MLAVGGDSIMFLTRAPSPTRALAALLINTQQENIGDHAFQGRLAIPVVRRSSTETSTLETHAALLLLMKQADSGHLCTLRPTEKQDPETAKRRCTQHAAFRSKPHHHCS
jgi:hypothetical protein